MIDTTDLPDEDDEGLHGFLRYLPKRIAAFEQRILRYRFEGWDPRGMAVLSGDVRRLADASARYDLPETQRPLLMLAQMVGEHLTNMRALDPQHAQRMFALLSAVTRSLPAHVEPEPRPASAETTAATDAQHEIPDAANADALPPPILEAAAPTVDAAIEVAAQVEPEEPVETGEADVLIGQVEKEEPIDVIEPPPPVDPVETEEPNASHAPAEPAEPVEPFGLVAADTPIAAVALIEHDEPDEPDAPGEVGMRRVYHLNDGNAFAIELEQRLESEGYAIEAVSDMDELSELLMCLMPQLLLVDPSHLHHLTAIAALRRDAQQHSQPQRRIQLVVMAAQDSMDTRRAAHRAGADLLLFAPFAIADLSRRLQELHATIATEKVRVLIVEDNRADALFAQTVLTRAGMQAEVERDPMQVLESLKAQRPDLVLMDLHMPFANGVEVTMLIREDPLFARLPIVFLSGESDPDSRLEAINAGGDDFLFKPIRPKHLIAAVQERVRRLHPVNREDSAPAASSEPTAG